MENFIVTPNGAYYKYCCGFCVTTGPSAQFLTSSGAGWWRRDKERRQHAKCTNYLFAATKALFMRDGVQRKIPATAQRGKEKEEAVETSDNHHHHSVVWSSVQVSLESWVSSRSVVCNTRCSIINGKCKKWAWESMQRQRNIIIVHRNSNWFVNICPLGQTRAWFPLVSCHSVNWWVGSCLLVIESLNDLWWSEKIRRKDRNQEGTKITHLHQSY